MAESLTVHRDFPYVFKVTESTKRGRQSYDLYLPPHGK